MKNDACNEFMPNKRHIGRLLAILSPGCLAMGYSMSYASQAHSLLQVKFDWRDSDESFYNWFMQDCLFLGGILGALIAGKNMRFGRRFMMLLGCGFGIFGGSLTLVMNYSVMLWGRTLLGFAMGMLIVAKYKYIEEYIPYKIYDASATMLFLMTILGVYLGNLSAYFLPDDALKVEFEDYEIWKIMSGAFIELPDQPATGELELLGNSSWRFIFAVPLFLYIL